jgi:hypothetical protein
MIGLGFDAKGLRQLALCEEFASRSTELLAQPGEAMP